MFAVAKERAAYGKHRITDLPPGIRWRAIGSICETSQYDGHKCEVRSGGRVRARARDTRTARAPRKLAFARG
eukprot:8437712-Lingulodinium_polyedra.AAC.1